MLPEITKITEIKENCTTAIITDSSEQFPDSFFSGSEKEYIKNRLKAGNECRVYRGCF
jgi:hypothetical protein